jgi:hypothetical protein
MAVLEPLVKQEDMARAMLADWLPAFLTRWACILLLLLILFLTGLRYGRAAGWQPRTSPSQRAWQAWVLRGALAAVATSVLPLGYALWVVAFRPEIWGVDPASTASLQRAVGFLLGVSMAVSVVLSWLLYQRAWPRRTV